MKRSTLPSTTGRSYELTCDINVAILVVLCAREIAKAPHLQGCHLSFSQRACFVCADHLCRAQRLDRGQVSNKTVFVFRHLLCTHSQHHGNTQRQTLWNRGDSQRHRHENHFERWLSTLESQKRRHNNQYAMAEFSETLFSKCCALYSLGWLGSRYSRANAPMTNTSTAALMATIDNNMPNPFSLRCSGVNLG